MRKNDAAALLGIAVLYLCMELVGITCPIRFVTGVSCAGCGMSRAWLALLRLDFAQAFRYHPLCLVPVPAALLLLFRRRLPRRVSYAALGGIAALFLAVYAVRLADPADWIVVFEPANGLLGRLLGFVRL